MRISSILAPFIEEAVFLPIYVFGCIVKKQMVPAMWVYFWVFYSIPLVYMSAFVPVPYWFCFSGSVV
jgi:hypothetical protein